ncbi:hypothetical protein ESCO_000498 [Escovopsis weberi]|uniref:Uncharacterized protein n=1 Tax=Escovopsis weberi TaxID=150374 RepID=A0A0M9VT57_ESCWE|nr:hypothetical protein ESCO_000498 [Escovopsis weberi]
MGVAAALGGLIGRQGARPESSVSSGEKGFYRVSGKKLPSVLQVGGDGYTDPRESSNSNYNQNSNTASIIHNNNNNNNNNNNIHNNIVITTTAPTNNNNDNSNNNKNGATATTPSKSAGNNLDIYQALRSYDSMDEITSQIALGNPMRPISGIPIIRDGWHATIAGIAR